MSRVSVAPISFGLGDLVVSLPTIQALIAQGRHEGSETWLVARSSDQARLADRIAGLAGWVDEGSFDRDHHDGRFVDLRDHPLQRDWWWGSPEFEDTFGAIAINDILDRISTDFGIPADFTRPMPMTSFPRPEYAASVLLVIGSDGPSKRWQLERWSLLAGALQSRGFDVRLVTRDEAAPEVRALGVGAAPAPTPGDALDMLGAARAVIGIDTGLTHIAAQQGTPTVTICRAPAVYFRAWPHTRAVVGDRCDSVCVAADKAAAYNALVDLRELRWEPRACPVGGRCLDAIQPDDVLRALADVL